jgi:AAA+ ATPase superfamily predicted ATPase
MQEPPFYGRQEELIRLNLLLKKKSSSLVVIKGRRRIGKSRLILEFSKHLKQALVFIGLPPNQKTTAQTQRNYFVQQMERLLGVRGLKAEDWGDLFWHLGEATKSGQTLVVLDEINWMGSCDPTFLGKLKSAWDLQFKNNPKLLMILSGSMSTWIDKNILSYTGFMGRISLELTLDELPLAVCNLFWRNKASSVSAYDKFKILSVVGGVPRYLEEIDPDATAEENIFNLAFRKGGLFVEEFDRIFSDLFSSRSLRYKQIIERLVDGKATLEQICSKIRLEKSGVISGYLEDLVETGYVAKDYTWNIKSGKISNLCKFRLKDNYLRFYLKYIEPKRALIEKNRIIASPNWASIMGIQFENLVVNNSHLLLNLLGLNAHEVVCDHPYFQRPSKTHSGCQIDYLIQSKFNTLHICEIKFSKEPVGISVVNDVRQKMERIAKPKSFSIRPVLIQVNGVTEAVSESDFFSHIIDFSQFLFSDPIA